MTIAVPGLPTNFQGCCVTGRFLSSDGSPVAGGPFMLTPSPRNMRDVTSSPKVTILGVPVSGTLSPDGAIMGVDGSGATAGIIIAASDDPDINPTNFTYSFSFTDAGLARSLPSFSFAAPSNTTVDLADVAPIADSSGITVTRGLQGPVGPIGPLGPVGPSGAQLGLPMASTVTTAGTLAPGFFTPADASAGAFTLTLPAPTALNQQIVVEKIDAVTTNVVTISGTIRGAVTTIPLSLFHETVVLEAESLTSWRPTAGHKTLSSLDERFSSKPSVAPTTIAQSLAYDPATTGNTDKLRWFTSQEHVARGLGWTIATDSRWAGGADPTGVADSTAAIMAAAASISNSTGGTLFLPPGTYLCNTVTSGVVLNFLNKSLFTLRGAGKSTIIKCSTAAATDFIRFDTCTRATIGDFFVSITGTANVTNAVHISTASPGSSHQTDVANVIIYGGGTYRFAHECSTVLGSNVITSATAQFTAGDVGGAIGVNQIVGPVIATISSVATVTGTVSNGGTAITAAQTTLPLSAALSGVPNAPYTVVVDGEVMQVTAGFQTATPTVARAIGSTSTLASTHADGATVTTYQATLSANATATRMPSVARIQPPLTPVMVNGIALGVDHPGASNIDLAGVTIHGCAVNNAVGAALSAGNGVAANVLANMAHGVEAAQSLYGLFLNGGGLKLSGCNFSTNGVDIKVGQVCSDPIAVSAFRTETPSRFYENELSTTAAVPTEFHDIVVDNFLSADGVPLRHIGASPLTLIAAHFISWGSARTVAFSISGPSPSFPCSVIGLNVVTNGGNASIWPVASTLTRITAIGGGRLNSSNQLVASGDGQRIDGPLVRQLTKQTLAVSGSVTIDASQGNAAITLQANAALSTITNPIDGQELEITWIQDATGGRAYPWPTNCKFAGGTAPSDTTASKRSSVRFIYDAAATTWNERSRAVAVG